MKVSMLNTAMIPCPFCCEAQLRLIGVKPTAVFWKKERQKKSLCFIIFFTKDRLIPSWALPSKAPAAYLGIILSTNLVPVIMKSLLLTASSLFTLTTTDKRDAKPKLPWQQSSPSYPGQIHLIWKSYLSNLHYATVYHKAANSIEQPHCGFNYSA